MSKARPATYFPHFIRIFSALGLWSALGLLFSLNVYAKANLTPTHWSEVIVALTSPASLSTHLSLAHDFWESGFLLAAKREVLLAQELTATGREEASNQKSVLGVYAAPIDVLHEWESEPARLESQYTFWQGVVKEKADYRDGYISLAALAYELSKPEEAKAYLSQAETLDPNSGIVKQLFSLLP